MGQAYAESPAVLKAVDAGRPCAAMTHGAEGGMIPALSQVHAPFGLATRLYENRGWRRPVEGQTPMLVRPGARGH